MSLSDELREIHGLTAFAELFGFDWDGDSDWTWHDVAVAMADRVDEELADEKEENGWAREFLNRMGRKCGTKDCPSLVAYVNKLEAENSKLRDEIAELEGTIECLKGLAEATGEENAKLRELVRDMWRDGMCECDKRGACAECEYHFPDRMRELGIEVE
ncbi:MAG: hypothetical protein IJG82_09405 [Atopobiaceae bacterium]|nr:hypothetical protein [Atopobiaceae bacterium]